MMIRVVQEAPLTAPRLVIHWVPFGAGVDQRFQVVQLQCAFAWFRGRVCFGDKPAWTLAIQNFFAIAGDRETADGTEKRLCFPRAEIKFGNAQERWLSDTRHIGD